MEIEEVREGGLWADHHRNSATHSLYLVLLNLYVAESIHVVHNEPHEEKKNWHLLFYTQLHWNLILCLHLDSINLLIIYIDMSIYSGLYTLKCIYYI